MGFSSEGWLIYCLFSSRIVSGDNGITGAVLLRPVDGGMRSIVSCSVAGFWERDRGGFLIRYSFNILRNRGVKP